MINLRVILLCAGSMLVISSKQVYSMNQREAYCTAATAEAILNNSSASTTADHISITINPIHQTQPKSKNEYALRTIELCAGGAGWVTGIVLATLLWVSLILKNN